MRRAFHNEEDISSGSDKNVFDDIDLLNLRVSFTSTDSKKDRKKVQSDFEKGDQYTLKSSPYNQEVQCYHIASGDPAKKNYDLKENNLHLLYKNSKRTIDSSLEIPKRNERVINIYTEANENMSSKHERENGAFPFKVTPSGNFKIDSKQVVFESQKLSVLVADPQHTKVNIQSDGDAEENEKIKPLSAKDNKEVMDSIMNQNGFPGNLGALIASTQPVPKEKESPEYESKKTCEILEPELNLNRLGYISDAPINWNKIMLPEKSNLYLELFQRITNYTNADCKVYISNDEFNCHLIVLQCYSEVFDEYAAVKKVELPPEKVSSNAFTFIYDWMIAGEAAHVGLKRSNVLEIFLAAKYLKIKDLTEQCWAFIDNTEVFNEDTAYLLYLEAKNKNLEDVKELMLPRIQTFFLTLVSSSDWILLDKNDIVSFLNSNYISINSEIEVFMSAVRWLKYDWPLRINAVEEVMSCVRFGHVAPWQLVDIKRNPENPEFLKMTENPQISRMIDDGLAFVIIKYWYGQENKDFEHWNQILDLREPAPRNWTGIEKTYFTYRDFLIFLDQNRRKQRKNENIKSPNIDLNRNSREIEIEKQSEKSLPIIPTIDEFLAQSKSEQEKRNELQKSPISKDSQSSNVQAKKMNETNLFLYDRETVLVFGGTDAHNNYGIQKNAGKNIFRYLPSDNIWEYVGDLPEPRHHHCVSFYRGKVYLCGGADPSNVDTKGKSMVVDTVWSFDPVGRLWSSESSLKISRKNFGLVACNSSIYAIGGQDKFGRTLASVEKYNADTKLWEEQVGMSYPRMGVACAKFQNRIWAAGGMSGSKKRPLCDIVEVFDTNQNQWTQVTRLRFPRCFASLFPMSKKLFLIGGAGKFAENDKTTTSLASIDFLQETNAEWQYQSDMAIPRHGHAVAYLGTQILIIGGVTTAYMQALNNTECYCTQRAAWIKGIACLPNAISGHAAVTLPPSSLL